MQVYHTLGYFYEEVHKVRFVTLIKISIINFWQTNSSIILLTMKLFEKYECFMSILVKISCLNFGSLNLHILKLHRKTILQQTPYSDTTTSGTPISFFFSTWYGGHAWGGGKKKKEEHYFSINSEFLQ